MKLSVETATSNPKLQDEQSGKFETLWECYLQVKTLINIFFLQFICLAIMAFFAVALAMPGPDPAVVYPYTYGYAAPVVSSYGYGYPAYSSSYLFKK